MKNLTNLQLSILTNAISEQVELAKNKFKESSEYGVLLETAKKEISYETQVALMHKYETVCKKIAELQEEKNDICAQYRDAFIGRAGYYVNITEDLVERKLQSAVESKLTQFPTKQKIQSDIVLMSMSGAENIIEAVLKKYNL